MFNFALVQFCILMFADDAVLIARTAAELQHLLRSFEAFCNENDLVINTDKTVVLFVNDAGDIFCNDVQLKAVSEFWYLGLLLCADARTPASMLHDRVVKSKNAFYQV